jgi:hypothetical protein
MRPLDAMPVENHVYRGTPDINYVHGWIETKQVARWPARGGPLKIEHFTPHQRAWIRRRIYRGGTVHVVLLVGIQVLIFDGEYAAKFIGVHDRSELERNAKLNLPHFDASRILAFFVGGIIWPRQPREPFMILKPE